MKLLVISLLLGAFVSDLTAADPLPIRKSYWKSDSFLSSFNGSYLPNSRIEPTLTGEQRSVLVSLQKPLASGNREQALGILKKSKLTSKSAALLYNQANLEFELGKLEEAKATFEEAIKVFPSFRRALRNLAFTLVRLNKNEEALKPLTKAIALGDQDPQALGMLGFLRLQEDQANVALQAYQQAMMLDSKNVNWHLGAAQALLELNRTEEALTIIDEQIAKYPTNLDLQLVRSDILLGLGQESDAAASLAIVKKVGKLDLSRRLLYGQLLLRRRIFAPAKAELNATFAELKPANLNRAIEAIATALQLGEIEFSRDLFSKLPEPPEKDSENIALLEARILVAENKPQEALAILKNIIAKSPLNGHAIILMAQLRASDAPEEALLLLEQASNIDAHAFDALVARSRLLVELKRYEDASNEIKKALKLRNDEQLAEYLEALQNLVKN